MNIVDWLKVVEEEVVFFDFIDDDSAGYGVYAALDKEGFTSENGWHRLGPIRLLEDIGVPGKAMVIMVRIDPEMLEIKE